MRGVKNVSSTRWPFFLLICFICRVCPANCTARLVEQDSLRWGGLKMWFQRVDLFFFLQFCFMLGFLTRQLYINGRLRRPDLSRCSKWVGGKRKTVIQMFCCIYNWQVLASSPSQVQNKLLEPPLPLNMWVFWKRPYHFKENHKEKYPLNSPPEWDPLNSTPPIKLWRAGYVRTYVTYVRNVRTYVRT